MKFPELLQQSFQRSEIPLRFEPGAEEALARPILELLRVWLEVHEPDSVDTEFAGGQQALIDRLLEEVDGARDVPE